MSENFEKDVEQKLEKAYEKMVSFVKKTVTEAEEKSLPALNKAIEKAQEKTREISQLTKRETEKLAEYLKKDLIHAAEKFESAASEFSEELGEEVKDIESGFFYWMLSLADPAKIQLRNFLLSLEQEDTFHTGEVTSAGVLECKNCGKQIPISKTAHIPPCSDCNGTEYNKL